MLVSAKRASDLGCDQAFQHPTTLPQQTMRPGLQPSIPASHHATSTNDAAWAESYANGPLAWLVDSTCFLLPPVFWSTARSVHCAGNIGIGILLRGLTPRHLWGPGRRLRFQGTALGQCLATAWCDLHAGGSLHHWSNLIIQPGGVCVGFTFDSFMFANTIDCWRHFHLRSRPL